MHLLVVKLVGKISNHWEAHAFVLDVFKYMAMGSARNKGKGELFFPVVAKRKNQCLNHNQNKV